MAHTRMQTKSIAKNGDGLLDVTVTNIESGVDVRGTFAFILIGNRVLQY